MGITMISLGNGTRDANKNNIKTGDQCSFSLIISNLLITFFSNADKTMGITMISLGNGTRDANKNNIKTGDQCSFSLIISNLLITFFSNADKTMCLPVLPSRYATKSASVIPAAIIITTAKAFKPDARKTGKKEMAGMGITRLNPLTTAIRNIPPYPNFLIKLLIKSPSLSVSLAQKAKTPTNTRRIILIKYW